MTGENLVIEMEKLARMNATFNKRIYLNSTGEIKDEVEPIDLDDNESVVLYMTLMNSTKELYQYIAYPLNGSPFTYLDFLESDQIYSINAILRRGDTVIGGYINDEFKVSPSDLSDKKEITIPLIEYRPEPVNEEQEGMMMVYIYNGDYINSLKPKFS